MVSSAVIEALKGKFGDVEVREGGFEREYGETRFAGIHTLTVDGEELAVSNEKVAGSKVFLLGFRIGDKAYGGRGGMAAQQEAEAAAERARQEAEAKDKTEKEAHAGRLARIETMEHDRSATTAKGDLGKEYLEDMVGTFLVGDVVLLKGTKAPRRWVVTGLGKEFRVAGGNGGVRVQRAYVMPETRFAELTDKEKAALRKCK